MKSENSTDNGECDTIGKTLNLNEKNLLNDITGNWHPRQKYEISLEPFISKSSEEFAYFLGFFYADGYNNIKKGKITITLKCLDKEILNIFSSLFFGNRPISEYSVRCQTNKSKVCSLVIGSRKLSNLLASYGAYQNKTFKIRFPLWLGKNLQRHFIRGYFDGDGSITKCGKTYGLNIAGNNEFNQLLRNIIYKETGINFGIIPHGKITVLYKGGNRNTKLFLDWLYRDCFIRLSRKYDRYLELLKEVDRVNKNYSHVYFNKKDKKWICRLPNKYGRKMVGWYDTKEEALHAYSIHPLIISKEL